MSNQTPGKRPDDDLPLGEDDLPQLPPLAGGPIGQPDDFEDLTAPLPPTAYSADPLPHDALPTSAAPHQQFHPGGQPTPALPEPLLPVPQTPIQHPVQQVPVQQVPVQQVPVQQVPIQQVPIQQVPRQGTPAQPGGYNGLANSESANPGNQLPATQFNLPTPVTPSQVPPAAMPAGLPSQVETGLPAQGTSPSVAAASNGGSPAVLQTPQSHAAEAARLGLPPTSATPQMVQPPRTDQANSSQTSPPQKPPTTPTANHSTKKAREKPAPAQATKPRPGQKNVDSDNQTASTNPTSGTSQPSDAKRPPEARRSNVNQKDATTPDGQEGQRSSAASPAKEQTTKPETTKPKSTSPNSGAGPGSGQPVHAKSDPQPKATAKPASPAHATSKARPSQPTPEKPATPLLRDAGTPATHLRTPVAKRATVPAAVAAIETAVSPATIGPRRDWGFRILQSTPPWMLSTIIHMLLLMTLAMFYVPDVVDTFLEIVVEQSEEVGEQMVSEMIVLPSMQASDVPDLEVALSTNEVENPLAAIRKLEIEEPEKEEPETESADAPTVGKALDGRQAGAKRALLAAYGGTGQTEDAVQLGLEWLKRNQQRDGSWSLEGPYDNGGSFENRPAATAMALLALQGAGNTHQEGDFRSSVERGMQALLKMQDSEGTILRHVRVENHRLYTQAQTTIALCELFGMTRDEALRKPAQRALDYAVQIQADDGQGGGGWRYMPGQLVDTSVTGWFVMALQSGKMAGLDVSQPALDKVSRYLDHVTSDGVNYQYMPDYEPSVVMTAEALLCRQYLGWQREDPRLNKGVKQILQQPIDWSKRDVYYWYYATQVLHHMGDEPWERWNLGLRKILPQQQERSGRNRGSWNPIGDPHGTQAGRLYTTCFSLYMLEVYYRHLPIYQHQ